MTSWNVFGERFSCLLGTSGRFAVFSHCLTVFVCPSFRVRSELISCLLETSCRCAGFSLYHGFLLFVRFYEEWVDYLIAQNSDRCAIFSHERFCCLSVCSIRSELISCLLGTSKRQVDIGFRLAWTDLSFDRFVSLCSSTSFVCWGCLTAFWMKAEFSSCFWLQFWVKESVCEPSRSDVLWVLQCSTCCVFWC